MDNYFLKDVTDCGAAECVCCIKPLRGISA